MATIPRSAPEALIALVTLMPAPAGVERFLPAPWNDWTGSLTIASLTRQLAGVPDSGAFGPSLAAAILTSYVMISFLTAGLAITRRDA